MTIARPAEDSREQLMKALVTLIVDIQSAEMSLLDPEDRELLVSYGCGKISQEDMMRLFIAKAARVEEQILNPQ